MKMLYRMRHQCRPGRRKACNRERRGHYRIKAFNPTATTS